VCRPRSVEIIFWTLILTKFFDAVRYMRDIRNKLCDQHEHVHVCPGSYGRCHIEGYDCKVAA
jgi:hypothetical protein